MITRAARHIEGGIPPDVLASVIAEHEAGRSRLEKLRRCYLGHGAIEDRARQAGLPNNRVPHSFARYIVTVTAGYLMGERVRYETESKAKATLDAVTRALDGCSAYSADVENARNAAIYGRGVELAALTRDGRPGVYALPPENAFVVYDEGIEHEPLFGVYLTEERDRLGGFVSARALTATKTELCVYENIGGTYACVSASPHYFGGVPMVEYWNDENEMGDFERVIPLIDAYDALQSDRVNDKEQFADKLLVLTGCTLDTDETGRPPWLQLRMDKALCLPDGEAKAQYLTAQMDENGNEILRRSLERDIHKLSLTPDLSDENFAGNVSGVAMKYKLMGLEQLAGMKQRWFEEGLRARLRLFLGYMRLRGYPELNESEVRVIFTRKLPEEREDA